jgi:putative SOS response-associated peptidase YedK
MCGRYTNTQQNQTALADRFAFDERSIRLETIGRANVCPTEPVLAVVGDPSAPTGRRGETLRWGLAPSWATLKGMKPLINARDDKLRTGGAWRKLAERAESRCLVLADGWLEWQKPEDKRLPRQPFLHRLPGGEPFAFAGLWCVARPKDSDELVASCTVITVPANREAAILHDRMPAVLGGAEAEAAWLSSEVDLDGALDLTRSLPDGSLEVLPVSSDLSRAGVEGLELLERVAVQQAPEPAQTSLL